MLEVIGPNPKVIIWYGPLYDAPEDSSFPQGEREYSRQTSSSISQAAMSTATTMQTNSACGPLYDAPEDNRFPQGKRDYTVPVNNFHLSYKMLKYGHKGEKTRGKRLIIVVLGTGNAKHHSALFH